MRYGGTREGRAVALSNYEPSIKTIQWFQQMCPTHVVDRCEYESRIKSPFYWSVVFMRLMLTRLSTRRWSDLGRGCLGSSVSPLIGRQDHHIPPSYFVTYHLTCTYLCLLHYHTEPQKYTIKQLWHLRLPKATLSSSQPPLRTACSR